MRERPNRLRRLIAITTGMVLLGLLASAGCAGGGVERTTSPTSESDPIRGSCGGAIVMDVRAALAGGPMVACASPAPLASGSPWPVSIRAAAAAFRTFTGEASLQFEVSGPFDSGGGRQYVLNSQALNAGGFFVSGSVDADTGSVTSVDFTPRAVDGPGARNVGSDSATSAAAGYLSAHSVDVAGLSAIAEPTDRGWEITWERMEAGAWVPPRVVVVVEWQTASVVSFRDTRVDLGFPPAAAITRAQAEAAAKGATWLTSTKVEDARLRYTDYGSAGPKLVWAVYLSGTGDRTDGPTYITILVDALTGETI